MSTTLLDRVRGQGGKGAPRVRQLVGRLFLVTAGVNLGMAIADASDYRGFADAALFGWVEDLWAVTFGEHPAAWALVLAAGELLLGILLLHGGTATRLGGLGVIVFHLALVLFGWGFLTWCLPALAVLVPAALRDWPALRGDTEVAASSESAAAA
jgi:hypothetical protein